MDKKELKFYDAPACEVVELKASAALMQGSPNPDDPFDDSKPETPTLDE
jgi:hypothetical protein